jgi:hypothetical protein
MYGAKRTNPPAEKAAQQNGRGKCNQREQGGAGDFMRAEPRRRKHERIEPEKGLDPRVIASRFDEVRRQNEPDEESQEYDLRGAARPLHP